MSDTTHLSRTTDPDTSAAAAERHAVSGVRGYIKKRLLEAVTSSPGFTSAEYAHHLEIDRVEAARRLADLMHDGDVEQGEKRDCWVGRGKAVTWWARA